MARKASIAGCSRVLPVTENGCQRIHGARVNAASESGDGRETQLDGFIPEGRGRSGADLVVVAPQSDNKPPDDRIGLVARGARRRREDQQASNQERQARWMTGTAHQRHPLRFDSLPRHDALPSRFFGRNDDLVKATAPQFLAKNRAQE